VPAESLELEILETAALTDMKKAVETITQCRKFGVQFALDDFGTGYSSLTYFLNLPVQLLKIDQSFVRVMLEDPGGLGIVESVVRLAQTFNRPVIAEGVETLEHGSMLLHFGCVLAQGYGISQPMPVEQVPSWLANWRSQRPWQKMIAPSLGQDVTLMVAAQSHRTWVDKVVSMVADKEGDAVIGDDSHTCSFGRWYRGSGVTRYGSSSGYREIAVHHDLAHVRAGEALAFARAGRTHEAGLALADIHESSRCMLSLLEKLPVNARS
jgi:hypothetical protein